MIATGAAFFGAATAFAGALLAGFAAGLAAAFGAAFRALFFSALRAGAALRAAAEGFDFAAVLSAVFAAGFLDFATALAMSDNNPEGGVEDARLTPFWGVPRKPRNPAFPLQVQPAQQAHPHEPDEDQV
ncbi:MAG: hypothetical protein ACK463_41730, partial [Bradyrhizobium sp.]